MSLCLLLESKARCETAPQGPRKVVECVAAQSTRGCQAAQDRSPAPTAAESNSLGSTVSKTPVREQAALDIREKTDQKQKKISFPICHL